MMPMGQGLPVGEEPELMMDINTTPLIDVLLVLLVMLIITIPIQLHAIDTRILATAPTAAAPPSAAGPIEIAIDAADRVTWQGAQVTPDVLANRMAALARLAAPVEVRLQPDRNCSYAVFAHVLAESRRQGLTRLSVVGSEQFR
jgi:biopolymer transport protein ExbD